MREIGPWRAAADGRGGGGAGGRCGIRKGGGIEKGRDVRARARSMGLGKGGGRGKGIGRGKGGRGIGKQRRMGELAVGEIEAG